MASPAQQPQFTEFLVGDFPLVAGCGLSETEQLLVEYWLSEARDRLRRWPSGDIQPGRLHRGLNYFPVSSEVDRAELLQCYRPLLVLAGRDEDRTSSYNALFNAGIAACWTVPAPGEPILFPAFPRPRRAGPVFLIEDDPIFRSIFRQLLYFAGYDVRADQHSLELLETPEAFAESADGVPESQRSTPAMPPLILASLDTERMDIPAFFHRLSGFLKKHPGRGPRVLLTKDFHRPGLDVRTIEHTLRPHATRIFHPREAVLALLEALFMNDSTPESRGSGAAEFSERGPTAAFASTPPMHRTLDELLYRPHIKLRETAPAYPHLQSLQAYRRMLPFLWLYDCLADRDGKGAILNA